MGIGGTIHTTTIKHLQELRLPPTKFCKLMEAFSHIIIRYLTHIIIKEKEIGKDATLDTTQLE
jgi:hypothetical protein